MADEIVRQLGEGEPDLLVAEGGHAAAIVLKHDELKGHLSVVAATDGIGAQTGGGAAASVGAQPPPSPTRRSDMTPTCAVGFAVRYLSAKRDHSVVCV